MLKLLIVASINLLIINGMSYAVDLFVTGSSHLENVKYYLTDNKGVDIYRFDRGNRFSIEKYGKAFCVLQDPTHVTIITIDKPPISFTVPESLEDSQSFYVNNWGDFAYTTRRNNKTHLYIRKYGATSANEFFTSSEQLTTITSFENDKILLKCGDAVIRKIKPESILLDLATGKRKSYGRSSLNIQYHDGLVFSINRMSGEIVIIDRFTNSGIFEGALRKAQTQKHWVLIVFSNQGNVYQSLGENPKIIVDLGNENKSFLKFRQMKPWRGFEGIIDQRLASSFVELVGKKEIKGY